MRVRVKVYYSAIGVLALLVLLIENQDVLIKRDDDFRRPAWSAYRAFLIALMVYYIVDIFWGVIEDQKLSRVLFLDTTVYFIAMAATVFFWTKFVVGYLDVGDRAGRILRNVGRAFCGVILVMVAINLFYPLLFSVDAQCVYKPGPARHAVLGTQSVMLFLTSAYAFSAMRQAEGVGRRRYRTVTWFGIIIGVFLAVQIWFPYLPVYTVAFMLGTSLLHAFVVGNEREEYRAVMAAAEARGESIVHTHIAQALAHGYEDVFYVNTESEEFVEYRTDGENGALTEVRRGARFFDQCMEEVNVYVHPDDRAAFAVGMNRTVLMDELDRNGAFVMAYRLVQGSESKYLSMRVSRMGDDENIIVIGVSNVDDLMRQRRAAERMAEESAAYARISALAGDFICIYIVDPVTGSYREYSATEEYETLLMAKEGEDFFKVAAERGQGSVYPDDLDRYLSLFTAENVRAEIARNGLFSLRYRLLVNGAPIHVWLKAAMIVEEEGVRLVVGINDVDAAVRQEEEYVQQLSQAQQQANRDALTGVKNRHAYLSAEDQLDQRIKGGSGLEFAIVVFDVNDLKTVNDTEGHQAGDQYLRDACKIICDVFKHSPVFRVGGDEFAVIAEGSDYEHIDELIAEVAAHNAEADGTGGIVIACGMAKYDGDPCVAVVFERADLGMYANKGALKTRR